MKNAARHIAREQFWLKKVDLLRISKEIAEIMKQPAKQQ
jgi:hypothetical protein